MLRAHSELKIGPNKTDYCLKKAPVCYFSQLFFIKIKRKRLRVGAVSSFFQSFGILSSVHSEQENTHTPNDILKRLELREKLV
jgi:hypothetical protein